MGENMNFQVDTSDYLGFKHEEYLDDLQSLAMSTPSKYYELRKQVLKELKQKVVEDVYKAYYNLLTKGANVRGDNIMDNRNPAYPQQLASQFSLGAAKTINQILDQCLDIILPASHLKIADLRIAKKAEGEMVDK